MGFTTVKRAVQRALTPLLAILALAFAPVRADVITTAAQVRLLSAAELEPQPPVRLHGVITFHEPVTGLTFLQDASAGVAVVAGAPSRLPPQLSVGTEVEVEGVAVAGAFAPEVTGPGDTAPKVKVLGRARLPDALPLTAEQLLRGHHDGRRVELRGVVRGLAVRRFRSGSDELTGDALENDPAAATRLRLDLGTAAGRFTVIVPWEPGREPPTAITEARVRVQGVLGSISNRRHQWAGILLFVPSLEDIVVERAPTVDPFALPLRETDEVMRFSPVPPEEERVRIEGTVTLTQPGFRLFLRGRRGPLEVQTPYPQTNVKIGSRVDVVGYPALLGTRVVLQDAQFRVVGAGPPPPPVARAFKEALERYADAELIQLTARLTQVTWRGSTRILLCEADGHLVEASFGTALEGESRQRIERLQPGSLLALTGVAVIQSSARWDGAVRSSGLNLLLRSAADVVVLRDPPWWTPKVLLRVMAVLLVLLLLGVVWVYLLRRRVEQQTAVIRRNVEREALWEERSRIARDIHDDVGAALTQIALLGELGRRDGSAPAQTQNHLERVTTKSREAVRALDEIVWTVNPRNDSVPRAASYICQALQDLLRDTGVRCRLQVADDLPDRGLAAKVRHNLFLGVKEAANNIIKHAQATEVRLTLLMAGTECRVTLEDNGRGFDITAVKPGRNGLDNLRRRLASIGGRCTIESVPGQGTTIRFAVPTTDGPTSNEGWEGDRE